MKTRLQCTRTRLRRGGGRAGGTPIIRARSRYAKKFTLHMYAKRSGVLHWELSDKNADTREIERVAVAAAHKMQHGDVLVWDRLGRCGRAVNPTTQHYSPIARAAFEECGVTIKFLPPKGKYFNPLELLFNDLKQHYIRPNFPKNGQSLSKSKVASLVRGYVDERASDALPGFFVQMGKMLLKRKSSNCCCYHKECKVCLSIGRCTK